MQLLGANGSTGTLRLLSRYAPDPAFIYFQNGNPIHANNGNIDGLDALYSTFGWKEGDFEFTQSDVNKQRTINKGRMGIILEGLKMVDDGQVEVIGPGSISRNLTPSPDGQ